MKCVSYCFAICQAYNLLWLVIVELLLDHNKVEEFYRDKLIGAFGCKFVSAKKRIEAYLSLFSI